jgi:hypothetical protein
MRVDPWRWTDAIVTVAACAIGLAGVVILMPQPLPSVIRPSGMAFPAYMGEVDPRMFHPAASSTGAPAVSAERGSDRRAGPQTDVRYALSRPATVFWASAGWSGGLPFVGSQPPTASHGGAAPGPGGAPPPSPGIRPSPVPSPTPTASPTSQPAPRTSSPMPPDTETSSPPPNDSSSPPSESPSPTDTSTASPTEETSTESPSPEDSSDD